MRHPTIVRWLCGVSLALSAATSTGAARAEGGVSLERFYPAPAGDRLLGVPSPFVAGERAFHVMLLADYAHNPLVADRSDTGDAAGAVVGNQLFAHIAGTLSLGSRVGIDVDIPVALLQTGDSPGSGTSSALQSPTSAQIGDIRVGARLRLHGGYFDALQIGLGAYLWLPSGSDQLGSFVGDGSVRAMPQLLAGGRTERLVWSAVIGAEIRPTQVYGGATQGTMMHIGAGAGFLFGEDRRIQIGPEITFATVVKDANASTTNAEILASAKYRLMDSVEAGLGLGLGLTSGVGTPDFRGVLMVAYTPKMERSSAARDNDNDKINDALDACPDVAGDPSEDPTQNGCPRAASSKPSDRDGDKVPDDSDACPERAGLASEYPAKNGCPPPPPPPDRDNDKVADDLDACPDVAGVASTEAKKNGCPPDRDNDSVPDVTDACPDVTGEATSDPVTNGCPADTDRDTIPDAADGCPRERGKPDPDPTKNGCPTSVRVTNDEIVILQQVQFEFGKAGIMPVSNALLDEVADVLKDHPEIAKIEVQGHTDNRGEPRFNVKLSDERAAAVVVALMQRGVDTARLSSKGYGSSMPIGNNVYEAGRQANRRVQFKIVQKSAK